MTRPVRQLWFIIKECKLDKIVCAFLIEFVLFSFIIMLVEPGITRFTEGLWYTFVACTSIGFGDIVPVTFIGRLLTIIITIHEILIIAIIPGIIVNYYQEVVKSRTDETVTSFLDKLEHLPELSKEELKELSKNVRKRRINRRHSKNG